MMTPSKKSEHFIIPFQPIIEATKNFTTLIGQGGYGQVYQGELSLSGELTTIAVKRLQLNNLSGQGLKEFLTEIQLLSRYKHPNLVSLLAFCDQGPEKVLIYEYAHRGSLDKYLRNAQGSMSQLTWRRRLNICIDAARGLDYLHNHVADHQRVIHRDIKSSNILIDHNWKAMIADLGLSKLGRASEKDTFLVTNACSTEGYCDPAYTQTGVLTKESDVYSFGVVLFEVLCGRLCFQPNLERKQQFLPQLAQRYYRKERLSQIIDPALKEYKDTDSVKRFSRIAYQCLLEDREGRPSMESVLQELEKALNMPSEHLSIPFQPIIAATKNFSTLIGTGGYGQVYKGELSLSGELTTVAVKRLQLDNLSGQGVKEFLIEIQLLSRYKHPNLVSLLGYCEEHEEKILIYEYAHRGSVEKYLRNAQNSTCTLTWKQRLNICIDAARGLDYLHNHVADHQRVIHRDIRSANILIDHNWKAMVADLGLSKLGRANENDTFLVTNACSTGGYCDPVYRQTGVLTKESDVYSFGVVLFEVLCGRLCFQPNLERKQQFLPQLAQRYYREERLSQIIDPALREYKDTDSVKRFSRIAYQCLLEDREGRPSMESVLQELEKALNVLFSPTAYQCLLEDRKGGPSMDLALQELEKVSLSSRLNNPSSSSATCQSFLLADIAKATNNFSNYLGKGAFGKVYSGNISGNSYNGVVAVKRMSTEASEGILAFEKEIKLVSACNHVNIISLVGFCNELDEKILLYELMQNGSLYDYLYKHKDRIARLTIKQRLEICIGVAKGLNYLHSRTDFVIIHSDLKTDNILLDQNLVPKISDFGLSRSRVAGPSISKQITNHIKGTTGYLAPECYEANYELSRKSDVYAYGIVLLEVLCERRAWDNLVILALPFIWRGQLPNFTPDYVTGYISTGCSRACAHLIMECLDTNPVKRPDMNQVVTKLEEALKL